jgi:hypothetical protein
VPRLFEAVRRERVEQSPIVRARPDTQQARLRATVEPREQLRQDDVHVGVGRDLQVGPPARRILVRLVCVDVTDQAPVVLEHADVARRVDGRCGEPRAELVGRHVFLAVRSELVRVHQLEHRVEVVVARRAQLHGRSRSKTTSSDSTDMPACS